jgi:hypothetical protein
MEHSGAWGCVLVRNVPRLCLRTVIADMLDWDVRARGRFPACMSKQKASHEVGGVATDPLQDATLESPRVGGQ